jgi:hypothetical protein
MKRKNRKMKSKIGQQKESHLPLRVPHLTNRIPHLANRIPHLSNRVPHLDSRVPPPTTPIDHDGPTQFFVFNILMLTVGQLLIFIDKYVED